MFARFALFSSLAGLVAGHGARGVEATKGEAATDGSTTDRLRGQRLLKVNRDLSTNIVLNFEGIGDQAPVGNFYNGGGGTNYGVSFSASAQAIVDYNANGTAPIANEPSPSTVMTVRPISLETVMTFEAGFTWLSFQYSAVVNYPIVVYDGPGGTGAVLANVTLIPTGTCESFAHPAPCGDPNGYIGLWNTLTVPFTGVAKSVRWAGGPTWYDDITITPYVPPPPPCTQRTYWLWNPTTDKLLGELTNSSSRCISVPYNIEVRPCTPPTKVPVTIQLKNATLATLQSQNEYFTPFYLWGDTTATGDVYPNKKPLPAGTYWLYSTVDGKQEKIKFTQVC